MFFRLWLSYWQLTVVAGAISIRAIVGTNIVGFYPYLLYARVVPIPKRLAVEVFTHFPPRSLLDFIERAVLTGFGMVVLAEIRTPA